MRSTPHSVKDHQIDKVMESHSQSSQILMNGIIEEKCKSKVDVGVGYWRWSWNFSFITLVRCAVQILSVEIQAWKFSFWLMKKSQRKAHQARAVAWLMYIQIANCHMEVRWYGNLVAHWRGEWGPIGFSDIAAISVSKWGSRWIAEGDITYTPWY